MRPAAATQTALRIGTDHPRSLAVAIGLGAASSSCSYAAVALARSLFRKGANFTAAMAFEIASTNLVIEMGIILALLMGWQFTLAEFVGAPLMILLLAVLFRLFLRRRIGPNRPVRRDPARRDRPRRQREPWLVIDPKPYRGDPCYDVLQHLLNCETRVTATPAGLAQRMADLLGLDGHHARQWLFARCVIEGVHDPILQTVAAALAPV